MMPMAHTDGRAMPGAGRPKLRRCRGVAAPGHPIWHFCRRVTGACYACCSRVTVLFEEDQSARQATNVLPEALQSCGRLQHRPALVGKCANAAASRLTAAGYLSSAGPVATRPCAWMSDTLSSCAHHLLGARRNRDAHTCQNTAHLAVNCSRWCRRSETSGWAASLEPRRALADRFDPRRYLRCTKLSSSQPSHESHRPSSQWRRSRTLSPSLSAT